MKRINSQTPQTRSELSRSEIKKRCAKKHRLKGKTLSFGKIVRQKFFDLTNKKNILSIRTKILNFRGNRCKTWETCKSWLYIISGPIKSLKKVKFTLKKRSMEIDKTPSNIYQEYIKNSQGNSTSFSSPGGTILVIPRKPYINITDFAFNSTQKEWLDLWKKVILSAKKLKTPFYISTHGHGVNWLHIRLEKKIKYKLNTN